MKKILLFPLLDSMPSGHHQVANAISHYINNRTTEIECKKIDLLHEWSSFIEPLVTKTYLSWIQQFPASYAWVYRKLAYKSKKHRSYKYYEMLFQKKMATIIAREKPDLIICTHAFPSYLINNLKKSGLCTVPLLNVYTDFFINDVWGKEMVDYHFVSDSRMKWSLIKNDRIPERKIVVTGIPIDENFYRTIHAKKPHKELNIILSGGSAGLGNITDLINCTKQMNQLNYYVLCGNNSSLYGELSKLNNKNIHPLPYLSSRKEMNELYDLADAIITKPGGVTVSEAIKKGVPIFIHSALPGQEEINLMNLKEQGLVFTITKENDLEEQIRDVLHNEKTMHEYEIALQHYRNSLDVTEPEQIFRLIESILTNSNFETSQRTMGGIRSD